MFNSTAKLISNSVRPGRVFQDVPIFGKIQTSEPASMIIRNKSACDEPPPKKCYTGRPKKRFVPDQDPKYEECCKKECDDYVPMDLQERKEYPPCRQKTWDDCPKPCKKVIRTCLTEGEKKKKLKCPASMCCNEKDGKVKFSTYAAARRHFSSFSGNALPIGGCRLTHNRADMDYLLESDRAGLTEYRKITMPVTKIKKQALQRKAEKAFRVMAPIPSFSECAGRTLPEKLSTEAICVAPTSVYIYAKKQRERVNQE